MDDDYLVPQFFLCIVVLIGHLFVFLQPIIEVLELSVVGWWVVWAAKTYCERRRK